MAITHLATAAVIDLADWNAAHVQPFVGAKVYATSTQSISAATEVPVTFDSEEFDTDAFHSGGDPTKFTIPSGLAGKYLLQAGGGVPNTGATLDFKLNGTTYLRGTGHGSSPSRLTTVGINILAVSDYVQVICYDGAGTTIGHASELQSQMVMTITFLGT